MKKVVLVLATTLTLLSCEKEITKNKNCDCDRVYKIENNGDHYSYKLNSFRVYTVNDCSKFNQMFIHQIYNSYENPIVGDCYTKQ
jgi:hypothetical protein